VVRQLDRLSSRPLRSTHPSTFGQRLGSLDWRGRIRDQATIRVSGPLKLGRRRDEIYTKQDPKLIASRQVGF
jgi:hypothetical protein